MEPPDPDLVLAALSERGRETVAEWEEVLGLEPGGLLRTHGTLLIAVAAARTSAELQREDPNLSATAALRHAVERIGFEDDPYRATHPGDSLGRQLRRWIAAEDGEDGGGHIVPTRDSEAA